MYQIVIPRYHANQILPQVALFIIFNQERYKSLSISRNGKTGEECCKLVYNTKHPDWPINAHSSQKQHDYFELRRYLGKF